MDENVMHTYTTVASQPKHFVQYDQVKHPVGPGCSEKSYPTQPGGGPVAVHSAAKARLEGGILCCKRLLYSVSRGDFCSMAVSVSVCLVVRQGEKGDNLLVSDQCIQALKTFLFLPLLSGIQGVLQPEEKVDALHSAQHH